MSANIDECWYVCIPEVRPQFTCSCAARCRALTLAHWPMCFSQDSLKTTRFKVVRTSAIFTGNPCVLLKLPFPSSPNNSPLESVNIFQRILSFCYLESAVYMESCLRAPDKCLKCILLLALVFTNS